MKERCTAISQLTGKRCKKADRTIRGGLCVIHRRVRYRKTHREYCPACGAEVKDRGWVKVT